MEVEYRYLESKLVISRRDCNNQCAAIALTKEIMPAASLRSIFQNSLWPGLSAHRANE